MKGIFDLNFKEGINLDLKIKKTSYYKQYLKGYIVSTIILFIIGLTAIADLFVDYEKNSVAICLAFIILGGFLSILVLLFTFKRFDLIKDFYEETKKEEKK